MSDAVLRSYLAPVQQFLDDPQVEEIIVNRPQEVFVESAGGIWARYDVPQFDLRRLIQLAELAATYSQQRIGSVNPLLSANLPAGQRLQIAMPPACPSHMFGMAIRLPARRELSLGTLKAMGCLALNKVSSHERPRDAVSLRSLANAGEIEQLLRHAVRLRKNILISGGTSSGKTTVMKALTEEIDSQERVVTIEDVREIELPHRNKLHLLASKGGQGVAEVNVATLLEACLRLRPDRILLGEMRGVEAADFLELVNTGHPGSISTVHADSPRLCFERLAFMVKRREGFQSLGHEALITYIQSVVDLIVQFRRGPAGRREAVDLWLADRVT